MFKGIRHPNEPATSRQREYYTRVTKQQLPAVCNRQQASDMIQEGLVKKAGGVKAPPKKKVVVAKPMAKPAPPKPKKKPVVIPQDLKAFIPSMNEPDVKSFIPREPYWRLVQGFHAAQECLLMYGDAGTGKTTMPKVIAAEKKLPYMLVSGDCKLAVRELFGQLNIKDGTSFFTYGTFTRLSQAPSIIHISEFNALDPAMSFALHEILNSRTFFVKEAANGVGKMFKLHDDCWLVFDGNPPGAKFSGTTRTNVALVDRLACIEVNDWTAQELINILTKAGAQKVDAQKLATVYLNASAALKAGSYRASVSLRGMKRAAKMIGRGHPANEAIAHSIVQQVKFTGGEDAAQAVAQAAMAVYR